jgi:hypothetical protein
VSVTVKFAWYDLWVGLFIDRKNWRLYICPLPALLITVQLPTETRFSSYARFSAQYKRAEALGMAPYQINKLWDDALYNGAFTPQPRAVRRFAAMIDEFEVYE